jgi:hypothetical protein
MADPQLDAIEDSDQEEEAQPEEPRARRRRAEVPLENLLRLLAGQRVIVRDREAAGSNDELVAGLKRSGMLSRCDCGTLSSSPDFGLASKRNFASLAHRGMVRLISRPYGVH